MLTPGSFTVCYSITIHFCNKIHWPEGEIAACFLGKSFFFKYYLLRKYIGLSFVLLGPGGSTARAMLQESLIEGSGGCHGWLEQFGFPVVTGSLEGTHVSVVGKLHGLYRPWQGEITIGITK